MWNRLKLVYGVTSTIRLRDMMPKFETDLMNHKHIITEHIRLCQLLYVNYKLLVTELSDDQQTFATIQTLPESWEASKLF